MNENDVARLYILLDNLFDVRVTHGGFHVSLVPLAFSTQQLDDVVLDDHQNAPNFAQSYLGTQFTLVVLFAVGHFV